MAKATANNSSKLNGAAVHVDGIAAKLKAARAEARKLRAENEALHTKLHEAEAEEAGVNYETEAQRRLHSALDEVMAEFGAPSWQRQVTALVVSAAVALGCGWVIGYVVGLAMMGAAVLTGSLIVVGMIYVLGMIVSMIVGTIAAANTYSMIASGRIDKVAAGAKDKVLGFFKAKPAFTGLFTKEAA